MKAFKEHENSICESIDGCPCSAGCDACTIIQKAAWKAALLWVKKEAISLDRRGDANRIVINRELES